MDWDRLYPRAGAVVSGLRVRRQIPNTSSIRASLDDWEELPGIREVPTLDESWTEAEKATAQLPKFYSQSEQDRTEELARAIKRSGEINPLIAVIDEKNGLYILEGGHRYNALRMLGIPSFPAMIVIDQTETAVREARENPAGGGLICMGRQVSFDLAGRKKLDAPKRNGMLHDPSGRYWSSCSLLIAPFENGDEEADGGEDYFGRNAIVYEGRCELPSKDLSQWDEIGTVVQVFYDRAGTKYPGYYKHKFNAPRGVYKLVALFKKRVAESKVVLYKLDGCYRLELPGGCIVDDRGIVLP